MDCNKVIGKHEEDCIHLHACRRLSKIARRKGHVARFCDRELCKAYENVESFAEKNGLYSYSEVQYAIDRATEDATNGYTDNIVKDYLWVM